jgi:hypothetical protein
MAQRVLSELFLRPIRLAVGFGHVVTFGLASTREADVASLQRHFVRSGGSRHEFGIRDIEFQSVA